MTKARVNLLLKKKEIKSAKKKVSVKNDTKNKTKKVGSLLLLRPGKEDEQIKEKVNEKKDVENVTKTSSESEDIMQVDKIKKSVEITFDLINNSNKKSLLDEEVPITLQITCIKIPKCPLRTVRYTLPHSLVNDSTEVCLIVPDLQKGRKVDPDLTINHYQDKLALHGITKIKIIPFTQLRLEYSQFEAKRRLLSLYDVFLVDGKLSGPVFHVLGKTFIKARKLPISIRLNEKDLKHEITKALAKTSILLTPKGNTTLTKVGHNKMTSNEITENILAAAEWLKSNYPGGWENIEAIYVKSPLTMSIPIRISLKSRNDVKIPVVVHHRRNNFKDVTGELSTIPGATVSFDADGRIKVTREKVEGISDEELDFVIEEKKTNKRKGEPEIKSKEKKLKVANKDRKENNKPMKKKNKKDFVEGTEQDTEQDVETSEILEDKKKYKKEKLVEKPKKVFSMRLTDSTLKIETADKKKATKRKQKKVVKT